VALAGLAVVVAAGVVVLWQRPSSRITQETCDRIHEGMDRAEVYAILGPPGDYTTQPSHAMFVRPPEIDGIADVWESDEYAIGLAFDQKGRVCLKRETNCFVFPFGPVDLLLWRLNRQWHRWFPE
jgi:hypothetical protein